MSGCIVLARCACSRVIAPWCQCVAQRWSGHSWLSSGLSRDPDGACRGPSHEHLCTAPGRGVETGCGLGWRAPRQPRPSLEQLCAYGQCLSPHHWRVMMLAQQDFGGGFW